MNARVKLAMSVVEAWDSVPVATRLAMGGMFANRASYNEAKRIVEAYRTRYITAVIEKDGTRREIKTDAQELRELRKLVARIERVATREGINLGNPAEHQPYYRITDRIHLLEG